MSWFIVGLFIGLLCSLGYIISLMNNKSRRWLVKNIFENSIYGDVLEYFINKEDSSLEEEDLLLGVFVLFISTAGILVCIIALLTFFGYISLFIFILFILTIITSNLIKKKK